jgi:tRNA pseudouridine55 synthase
MNQAIIDSGNLLQGGVIVVDKPADITSAGVVRRLKRLPGINKIGHAGTLDPFATGVLVCTINQGTRISRFLLSGQKRYAATLRLGISTDSQDYTGIAIAEKPVGNIPENTIHEVFSRFKGDLWQLPPAYSALKHNGIPLYKHARSGNPIQKPARLIHISSIGIRCIRLPDVAFEVACSAGTYIRTICADIGEALGCGGHLLKLDRLESSGFKKEHAVSLAMLEAVKGVSELQGYIIPLAEALPDMPSRHAGSEVEEKIRYGRPLAARDFPDDDREIKAGQFIKVTTRDNRLLAVIYAADTGPDYKYCCVFN